VSIGFPLHIDIVGNNCTVFGGGESAARRAEVLLRFGAKVTVISPELCPALVRLSEHNAIRHIPRKYFRGDCTNSQICIAATDDNDMNIRIATECKAKSIPVNVTSPADYGTFRFPRVILQDDLVVTVAGDAPTDKQRHLRDRLKAIIPTLLQEIENE
jgi:uroporphyrin-III C-methyltransferase/precorrin-2 dehydrogenase/sirohydrochlorin ferrochelatase